MSDVDNQSWHQNKIRGVAENFDSFGTTLVAADFDAMGTTTWGWACLAKTPRPGS